MDKGKAGVLKDDGERMIPAFHKNNIMYGEHLGRYMAVEDVIRGKVVLDIASGSGYGTKLMARHAKFVYGVDIDKNSIEYANLNFAAINIEYIEGNGTKIPLGNDSVDCVISMETIEHIEDQESFLSEVKRILKPGGFMVLSTPNDKVYPKGNHYHVREHSEKTLTDLLGNYFKHTKLCYQVVSIAASVLHEADLSKDATEVDWQVTKEYASKPDNSIYYLAICSDGNLPDISNNTLLSQEFSHMEQKKIADYIGDLHVQVNNLRINLEHELGEARRLTEEVKELSKEKGLLTEELERMKNTAYWFRVQARRAKSRVTKKFK